MGSFPSKAIVKLDRAYSFDIETAADGLNYALQPWRGPDHIWLTTMALCKPHCGEHQTWTFPTVDDFNAVLEECVRTQSWLVGWNLQYEAAILLSLGDEKTRQLLYEVKMLDGLLLYKRFDQHWMMYQTEEQKKSWEGRGYGLKSAVERFIPEYAGYEGDVDYDIPRDTPADDPRVVKLLKYNLLDTALTARLTKMFFEGLIQAEQLQAIEESAGIVMAAESWLRGINVNRDCLVQVLKETVPERNRLLAKIGLDATVLDSPTQLSRLIFKPKPVQKTNDKGDLYWVPAIPSTGNWGYTPIKKGKNGLGSTDKTSLTYLALDDDRFNDILAYRKLTTRLKKFCESPAESVPYNGDGCTHPSPKIRGTYTGRMTYSAAQKTKGPNAKGKLVNQWLPTGVAIHQWEANKSVRQMLQPPAGYLLAEFDWSGQEMRLMADFSGDQNMLSIFQEGKDGHSLMASEIYGVHYDNFMSAIDEEDPDFIKMRKVGKLANFSLQYRTGYRKFRDIVLVKGGVAMTPDQARQVTYAYRDTYPSVPIYWKTQVALAKANGYIKTAGHSVIKLQGWGTQDDWKLEQSAINFPIQGTGADMKALGLSRIKNYCYANGIYFAWDLHDGLFFYLPEWANPEGHCRHIREILSTLPYRELWQWDHILEYPVDCKLGPNWGDLKPLT